MQAEREEAAPKKTPKLYLDAADSVIAQGKGTASGVQRVALEFLATDAVTKWMTAAMDGR